MDLAVADHLEEGRKACLHQHGERVAADREDATGFNLVLSIQNEDALHAFDAALVDDSLAVIL
ncbi:MAG TPA: hypothetical protein DEB52_17925, partial [Hyphomonas sp.]|nr:hypothetical protein [Hyphomonas sp.]